MNLTELSLKQQRHNPLNVANFIYSCRLQARTHIQSKGKQQLTQLFTT